MNDLPEELLFVVALAGGLRLAATLCCVSKAYCTSLSGLADLHKRRARRYYVTWYSTVLLFRRLGRLWAYDADEAYAALSPSTLQTIGDVVTRDAARLKRDEALAMLLAVPHQRGVNHVLDNLDCLNELLPFAIDLAGPIIRRPVMYAIQRNFGQWSERLPRHVHRTWDLHSKPSETCKDCGAVTLENTRADFVESQYPMRSFVVCKGHQGFSREELLKAVRGLLQDLPTRILQLMCIDLINVQFVVEN